MSFNMNASISEEMCRFELTFSYQNFNEQQETDFIKQSDIFVIINTLALTFNFLEEKYFNSQNSEWQVSDNTFTYNLQ